MSYFMLPRHRNRRNPILNNTKESRRTLSVQSLQRGTYQRQDTGVRNIRAAQPVTLLRVNQGKEWSKLVAQLVLSTGTTALNRPWLGTGGLPARAPSSPPSPWNLRQAPPRRLGDGDGKTDPHNCSQEPFHRRISWNPLWCNQASPTTPKSTNKENP